MGLFRANETNIQMESNIVKNPNWLEANQLAILQMWSRIWTRDYREQIQLASLELGASELQVQRPNRSATLLLSAASRKALGIRLVSWARSLCGGNTLTNHKAMQLQFWLVNSIVIWLKRNGWQDISAVCRGYKPSKYKPILS